MVILRPEPKWYVDTLKVYFNLTSPVLTRMFQCIFFSNHQAQAMIKWGEADHKTSSRMLFSKSMPLQNSGQSRSRGSLQILSKLITYCGSRRNYGLVALRSVGFDDVPTRVLFTGSPKLPGNVYGGWSVITVWTGAKALWWINTLYTHYSTHVVFIWRQVPVWPFCKPYNDKLSSYNNKD